MNQTGVNNTLKYSHGGSMLMMGEPYIKSWIMHISKTISSTINFTIDGWHL